jgi:hypothetical protein
MCGQNAKEAKKHTRDYLGCHKKFHIFACSSLSLARLKKKKKVFVSEELNNTKQYARIRDAVVVV